MDAADLLRQVREAPRFTVEVALLLDAAAFDKARKLNDALMGLAYAEDDVTADGPVEVAEQLYELYRNTPEQRFVMQARTAAEWDELRVAAGDDDGEFVLHLFAACCTQPGGWTVEAARELRATLTVGQWATLVAGLRQLNEGLFDLRPTTAATALMRGMRQSLTTALPEE